MSSSEPNAGVHLRDVSQNLFLAMAGFLTVQLCVVFFVFGLRGEWKSLFVFLFPAGLMAVAYAVGWATRKGYVILHADRMELPGHKKSCDRVLEWSKVRRLRWSVTEPHISITGTSESPRPASKVLVNLEHLSSADRLTLIRYLRASAANIEQENWPRFCYARAVPLVRRFQQLKSDRTTASVDGSLDSSSERCLAWFDHFGERHAFLAGFISPLLIAALVVAFATRKTWWKGASIFALSSMVNALLVCGHWSEPLVSRMLIGPLAIAAAIVVTGFFAPRQLRSSRTKSTGDFLVLWVRLFFLVAPLICNAIAVGWISYKTFAGMITAVVLYMIGSPVLFFAWRGQQDRTRVIISESDAVRRWAEYERTGYLPDRTEAEGPA